MALAGTAYIDYEGRFGGLQNGAKKAADEAAGHFRKSFANIGKAAAVGVAAIGSAAVTFAGKSAATFENVGKQVIKLQRYTGATAEQASRLRVAFQLSGLDTEKAARALGLFSKNLVAGNVDKYAKAITGVGIATRDANGKLLPMHDVLLRVADRFKGMPNGAEKTALAMKLFGKAGADMLPFLNRGAAGIADLEKQSDKYGTTLGGKDVDAVKKSIAAHRLFTLGMQGLQIQIGRYVLPVVDKFIEFLSTGIPVAAHAVGAVMRWLGPVFDTVGTALSNVFTAVGPALATILGLFGRVRADIGAFVSGFTKGTDALGSSQGKWAQWGAVAYEAFLKVKAIGAAAFEWIRTSAVPALMALGSWLGAVVQKIGSLIASNPKAFFIGLAAVVLLLVSPFALLAAGVAYAYTHFEGFRKVVAAVATFFTSTVLPALVAFGKGVADVFARVAGWVQTHWDQIKLSTLTAWHIVENVVKAAALIIGGIILAFVKTAEVLWSTFGSTLIGLVTTEWNFIKGIIHAALNIIMGTIRLFMAIIHGDWGKAWDAMKQLLGGVWEAIKAVIRLALGIIKGDINGGMRAVLGIIKSVGGAIRSAWDGIWSGITGSLSGVWNGIGSAIAAGVNVVISVINTLIGAIDAVLSVLPGGLHIGKLSPVGAPARISPASHYGASGGGGSGTHTHMARGGLLPGYGGGDRRHIIAEDGEFVVNKQATRRFLPLLARINGGMGDKGDHYSLGGWVGNLVSDAGAILSDPIGALGRLTGNLLRAGAEKLWGVIRGIAEAGIAHAPLGSGMVRDIANAGSQKIFEGITNWIHGADQAQSTKNDAAAAAAAAAGGGSFGASIGPVTGGLIARIEAVIKSLESGGNYSIVNSIGAAGAYQFLPGTWRGLGGPGSSAAGASPAVQDAVAGRYISSILAKNGGNVASVPVTWYIGHYNPGENLNFTPPGNSISVANYVAKWMARFAQTAPTSGTGAAGHRAFAEGGIVGHPSNVTLHAKSFDSGGILAPGWNLLPNRTGVDEHVVPKDTRPPAPLIHVENQHINEAADADLLMQAASFAVASGRL